MDIRECHFWHSTAISNQNILQVFHWQSHLVLQVVKGGPVYFGTRQIFQYRGVTFAKYAWQRVCIVNIIHAKVMFCIIVF